MGVAMIEMWTDGACDVNTGAGGWAVKLTYNDHERLNCGHECGTTNNRMELQAVIEGLKAIKRPCPVRIYIDSDLILHCAQRLWKRKKNLDLWQQYDAVAAPHEIEWVKVDGHSGVTNNELVDRIAQEQRDVAKLSSGEGT